MSYLYFTCVLQSTSIQILPTHLTATGAGPPAAVRTAVSSSGVPSMPSGCFRLLSFEDLAGG